jgi:putative aldouronate transport system substrate-binding protein
VAYLIQKKSQNNRSGKTEKQAVKTDKEGVFYQPEKIGAVKIADKMLKTDPGTAAETPAGSLGTGRISYPIRTDVTLTYWVGLTASLQNNFSNMGDTPFARGLQERTGVRLQYLHPAAGSATEQFNLMLASQEYPDLIDYNWLNFPGGPERALGDRVIIPLNDAFARYAPNLSEFLRANPRYDKMVKTDEKNYYVFPFLRGDDRLCSFNGIYLRKDWLDELGLQVPETFDEWHTVLTAFKDRKGSRAPLTMGLTNDNRYLSNFLWGLGVYHDWYLGNDGRVRYGAIETPYREFISIMARWYREGLLDPDFVSLNLSQVNQKMTTGASGASVGNLGRDMGGWTPTARNTDPKFTLVAAKPPVLRKGTPVTMLQIDNPYTGNGCVAISSQNKNVEISARMLDWGYSAEGFVFYNFGAEGVAHNTVNGRHIYTNEITNNPRGWSMSQAISAHARSAYNGPFIQAYDYQVQFFALPEQNDAPDIWKIPEPFKHKMPPISPNANEASEMARIMGEVNTYWVEMLTKFVMGTETLNDASWNTFVSTIRRMGIDRAVEIQNAALVRYNNR